VIEKIVEGKMGKFYEEVCLYEQPFIKDQTMTIELSKPAASGLLATIERRSGHVANNTWWGDSYWKTTRNKDNWGGAGTIAQK